jgi:hypothetical protein
VSDDEPRGLATHEPKPLVPDEYEQKYMGGESVLARSRVGMPAWFHLLFLPLMLGPIGAAIGAHAFAPLLAVPIAALAWILLSFLRVAVTTEHVHVQYGPFGPKIPIERIERAEAANYEFMKYGGWGIRRSLDGSWAYSVPGVGGRGVKVAWRDANGKLREVFVTATNPESLVAAIERARGGRPAGVRVVADEVRGEGIEVPAERAAQVDAFGDHSTNKATK